MFRETPTVTQNIIILNIIVFVATILLRFQGINLDDILGAHYFNTPLFKPWQLITHAFMHADVMHIFMNMFVLYTFGSFLERLWGPKRFFSVYLLSAFGAIFLYSLVGYFQVHQLQTFIDQDHFLAGVNGIIQEYGHDINVYDAVKEYMIHENVTSQSFVDVVYQYTGMSITPMVGASGAVFGLMAAFAILFPNTEMQLLFIPFPIKAKYLIGGYFVFELYASFHQYSGDHVAHLAHVGGAIVGAIIVLFWRKSGRSFY